MNETIKKSLQIYWFCSIDGTKQEAGSFPILRNSMKHLEVTRLIRFTQIKMRVSEI